MKKHGILKKSLTLAMLCLFSITMLVGMGRGDVSSKTGDGSPFYNSVKDCHSERSDESDYLSSFKDSSFHFVPFRMTQDCTLSDSRHAVKEGRPLLPPMDTEAALATLQCKYFDEKDFMNSVIAFRQNQLTGDLNKSAAGHIDTDNTDRSGSIAGGIVPHHLLAGKMIAAFFQALAESSPDTIVIIAPNHGRIGLNGLHTSTRNWGTAFGILEADPALTGMLIDDLNASQNTALMEEEHSISSLVPFIKYYLPEAKIVPVLLHGNYSQEASQRLGELLAEALSDNPSAVVIASVDFSHYLDADTANEMDNKTLAAINSNDILAISIMGNDNLDSPPSIIALLSAMEKTGAAGPEVLAHGNSSDITGSGADYTTSYYTILFRH